jgi:hypothetical protein
VFAGRRYQRGHGLGSIFGGLFKAAMPLLEKGTKTVSIAFWSKFSLVDFNRDVAACLIFIPCTTSPAICNLVFKASRSRVFVPFSTKSELDLFEVPSTQTSVAYGYWEQKGLTSALTDQGPYEFAVSGVGDDYIDLANTY